MTGEIPVLLAATGPGEADLVRAMNAARGLRVVRRCADGAEVLAAAGAQVGAVAVIAASLLGVDGEFVDRLQRAGLRVVGIAAPEDTGRAAALGCDAVVSTLDPPSAVVAAVAALPVITAVPPPPPPPKGAGGLGQVVVVWGPHGAPGRTSVAINLAASLQECLLVDADTRAPSVAQTLGVLDESSGLAAASRLASDGRLTSEGIIRAARKVGTSDLLTGLTRPDRWREVPGSALTTVLRTARETYRWTVVDCAGGWEEDADGAATAFAPKRDSAQVAALREADVLVVVGTADPVGVVRLVELLAARPRLSAREIVAVTRARTSVTGPAATHAVKEALARFAGRTEAIVIPDDRPGFDAALLAGTTLAEAAPSSPALAGFDRLSAAVTGTDMRRAAIRTRRRGRPAPLG